MPPQHLPISITEHDSVLLIQMRDGTVHIKTDDEMRSDAPQFRGIVIQTHILNDADMNPIDQLQVVGWKLMYRGFIATHFLNGKRLRVFALSWQEAWNTMYDQVKGHYAKSTQGQKKQKRHAVQVLSVPKTNRR